MLIALVAAGTLCGLLAGYAWHLRRAWRKAELARRTAFAEVESLHYAFSRFVPSSVVDDIVALGVSTRAEKREVTILFADLKGFTRMSEDMDPAVLVEVLNGYFSAVSAAITEHHGLVSKFMGDGLMALFGALEPNPWQARDAVDAALSMLEAVRTYNERLAALGRPSLEIGIGIHQGAVVAGMVGSAHLMEYTVLGDTVNVAARVESLTRQHEVDLLITQPVRDKLDARYDCRELAPVPVKGKREPIVTFAVQSSGERTSKGPARAGQRR